MALGGFARHHHTTSERMPRLSVLSLPVWISLAPLLWAQAPSAEQRAALQVQALIRLVGPAPYEHPAGIAGRLCLGPMRFRPAPLR